MRRMRDIVRLPVVDSNSEERLGWVSDIVYNEKNNRITGVIIEKDTLLTHPAENIVREDIVSIGKDALAVKGLSSKRLSGSCWSQKVGSKVYDSDGDIKGTVGDIYVDNQVQKILGYEISDGLFADLLKGREAVFEENILGEDLDVVVIEGGSLS
ncbi:PRC-barrel domain-containing protein [Dehalobacter sp. DCM]|uniref:PRC-barrel domain-containing protein n=1 Tax=Dehalobacter sp. DCM TaxID=2907827 RepID=UPI0030813ECD|nr:PRC-barrel domain-containing protein [Dehalobacter sp. DCM]